MAGAKMAAATKKIAQMKTAFAALGAAVPILTLGLFVKEAANFERGMRNVNSIMGLNERAFENFSQRVMRAGTALGMAVGPAEAAAASYDIASAGFLDAAQNARVLEASMIGATAGLTDTKTAAAVLVGSLNAYSASMGEAADVSMEAANFMDIMFETVKRGVITFEQLAKTLGNVTSIAANAGVSFAELNAAMAIATKRGINASKASIGLRGIITKLIAPTDLAKRTMQEYGIAVNASVLEQKGLIGTLQMIQTATGGNIEAMRNILGDVRALNIALALLTDGGQEAADTFAYMSNELLVGGSALEAAREQQKSFAFQWDLFKTNLEALAVTMGQELLPLLNAILKPLTDFVKWMAGMDQSTKVFLMTLMTFVGVFSSVYLLVQGYLKLAALWTAAQGALGIATKAKNIAIVKDIKNLNLLTMTTKGASASTWTFNGALATTTGTVLTLTAVVAAFIAILVLGIKTAQEMEAAHVAMGKSIEEDSKRTANYGVVVREMTKQIGDSAEETAKNLVKEGKTAQDVGRALIALRQQMENVRNSDIAPAEKTRQLAILEEQFLSLKATLPLLDQAIKDHGETSQNEELKKQAAYLDSLEAWQEFQDAQTRGDFEQGSKNRLESVQKEVAALDEVIEKLSEQEDAEAQLAAAKEERLRLTKKLRDAERDAADEAAQEAEKKLKEEFEAQLAVIENAKAAREITKAQELQQLKELREAYKDYADFRMQLDRKIAQVQGQIIDENARKSEENKRKKEQDAKTAEQQAEKRKKLERELEVETIKATEGEAAAKLKALEFEYQEHLKTAKDKKKVDEWYAAQKAAILEESLEDEKKKLQDAAAAELSMRKEILKLQGKDAEVAKIEMAEKVAEARKAGVTEKTIAEWLAAKKKELQEEEKEGVKEVGKTTTETAKKTASDVLQLGRMQTFEEAMKSLSEGFSAGFGKMVDFGGDGRGGGETKLSSETAKLVAAATGESPVGVQEMIATAEAAGESVQPGTAAAGGAPAVGGVSQQVRVAIEVDGKVRVTKGPLSDETANGLLEDLGLMDHTTSDFGGGLGRSP